MVVCTDVVIKELGVVDANTVLHYDAAETPLVFAQRFSTMWRWFKSRSERQDQKVMFKLTSSEVSASRIHLLCLNVEVVII